LERVRKLLRETEQSIAAVALEVGFSSQSHLTTAFRQRFAMTPAQYRIDCGRRQFRKST
jgi:AraC family transcriptional regulator